MCELNVFTVQGDNRKMVMEDVVRLVVDNNEITLAGMLGDVRKVRGKILHIDLTKQEALIEKIE